MKFDLDRLAQVQIGFGLEGHASLTDIGADPDIITRATISGAEDSHRNTRWNPRVSSSLSSALCIQMRCFVRPDCRLHSSRACDIGAGVDSARSSEHGSA